MNAHTIDMPATAHAPAHQLVFRPALPDGNSILIFCALTCGRDGEHREFPIACIEEALGQQPMLLIQRPLGVTEVSALCELIQQRKHLS